MKILAMAIRFLFGWFQSLMESDGWGKIGVSPSGRGPLWLEELEPRIALAPVPAPVPGIDHWFGDGAANAWNVAGNWDNGVPTPTSTVILDGALTSNGVVLPAGGTTAVAAFKVVPGYVGTVNLNNGSLTVASFDSEGLATYLGGGAGGALLVQNATGNGQFTWISGSLSALTLTVGGGAGTGQVTGTWTAGTAKDSTLTFASNSHIVVTPTVTNITLDNVNLNTNGVFELDASAGGPVLGPSLDFTTGGGAIVNTGEFDLKGGSITFSKLKVPLFTNLGLFQTLSPPLATPPGPAQESDVSINFNNNGRVIANSYTILNFNGSGVHLGSFLAQGDSVIAFTQNSAMPTPQTNELAVMYFTSFGIINPDLTQAATLLYNGTGAYEVTFSNKLVVDAGVTIRVGSFLLESPPDGILLNESRLTINGAFSAHAFEWTSGRILGSNPLYVGQNDTLVMDDPGSANQPRTLDNESIANEGAISLMAGSLTVNGVSGIVNDGDLGQGLFGMAGGTSITVGVGLAIPSVVILQNGAILTNSPGLRAEIDLPVLNLGGTVQVNGAGGLFLSAGYVQIAGTMKVSAVLNVSGTFEQDGGTTAVNGGVLSVAGNFVENGGTVTLSAGTVDAANVDVAAGAVFSGDGAVNANVNNAGVIQVASPGSIGSLTTDADSSAGVYGNLTETSTAALDVAIAGATSYDTLSVAGATTLGGTLNVQLLDNFAPTVGEWFELMPGMTSGQFATVNAPTVNGVTLVPEYNVSGEGGFSLLAVPATTTSLSSNADPSNAGQLVTLTASVMAYGGGTPTGSIRFFDGSTLLANVPLAPGMTTATYSTSALSVGSHGLTAVYSGDSGHAPSTSPVLTQTVQLAPTSTSLASSLNPSAPGQSVTFTASVMAYGGTPTGSVTFYDGQTVLGTGTLTPGGMGAQATFTTSGLSLGGHSVTAVYNGSPNFAPSTSSVLTETVQLLSTSTALASSANPSTPGQSVTLTASVTGYGGATPTGSVQFFDGPTLLATVAVTPGGMGAQAAFSTTGLALGGHSLHAVYSGDGSHAASTSSVLTQTVQLAQTYTSLASSLNPSAPGQAVTLTASVMGYGGGVPTGTATFYDGQTVLGTGTLTPGGMGAQATLSVSSLTVGSHSLTVVYSGDAAHAASTSSVLTQTVRLAQTYTSLASSLNPSPFGNPVTFTATIMAGGSVSGTVSFYDGTTLLATVNVSNGTATYTTSVLLRGSHSITAVYSGDLGDLGSTSSVLDETIQ